MGGKTKSTTTVNVPPPSQAELDDQAIARAINQQNLYSQGYELQKQDDGSYQLIERPLTEEEQKQKDFDTQLNEKIRQRLLGGPVDDETKALVGETYNAQRELGQESISQFMREQAGMRGMDLTTDTPLQKELGLATSRFETGLRGAEAASLLDSGNRQQLFSQALNEFQNSLQQQSFINRASIGESSMQNALGLSRQRMMQPTTTTTQSGGSFFNSPAFGSLMQAGASGIGAYMASSKEYKENIEPADHDKILDEIKSTPVYEWNYKDEFKDPRRHVGPITEEAPSRIVTADGKALVVQDTIGALYAATKALAEKVEKLESE